MKATYILALDQGTTGTRAFLYDRQGQEVARAYQTFKQTYPQAGWVEHDAQEIWKSCCVVIKRVMRLAGISGSAVVAIGITNQRETTVLWDRQTGQPVGPAICWQCRRTASICQRPRLKKAEALIRQTTGLVLDPYFSGTKILWYLEQQRGLRQAARQGRVCFGTIDTWLISQFTSGQAHVTDMTNASRTLLFDIHRREWSPTLLKLFQIPEAMLPTVQPSGGVFGTTVRGNGTGLPAGIPIRAVLGDQQAALYGQGCFETGTIKNTYGTGCFMVLNMGQRAVISRRGLLTTVASDVQGQPLYAMEGAVFMAGAVMQWLRDQLGVMATATDSEKIVAQVADTHGVYFVPAFVGLGAPYWDSQARGVITGLTRGADYRHITRAALESIAYQTRDIFDIMKQSVRGGIQELRVDGGACVNDFLMQFQADILGCPLRRPRDVESTVRGAAQLAGVNAGIWSESKQLSRMARSPRVFRPVMSTAQRNALYRGWQQAVQQTQNHGKERGA